MKTRHFVSFALALALMISVPSGAGAAGLGQQCGRRPWSPSRMTGNACSRHLKAIAADAG